MLVYLYTKLSDSDTLRHVFCYFDYTRKYEKWSAVARYYNIIIGSKPLAVSYSLCSDK